jgi:putative transposase
MPLDMAGHGAPRLTPFAYRGLAAYSVTVCTFGRRHILTDTQCVEPVSDQLLQHAARHRFDVSVYCCMPDHMHVLLEATAIDSDLRKLMNSWKQKTGYFYKHATGSRLWQSGYYDHVLRQDEENLRVIAYLLANPIRAGLVADLGDYPFWGSAVWTREHLIDAVRDLVSAHRTL